MNSNLGTYLGIAFEFLGFLAFGGIAGYLAGEWLDDQTWFLVIFLVSFAIGIYYLYKRAVAADSDARQKKKQVRKETDSERMDRIRSDFERISREIDKLGKK